MSFRVEERDMRRDQTLIVGDGLDHDTACDLVNALHDDASSTYLRMFPSRTTEPIMFRDLPSGWSR